MKFGKIIGQGVLVLSLRPTAGTVVLADGGDATLIHACVLKDGTMRIVECNWSQVWWCNWGQVWS